MSLLSRNGIILTLRLHTISCPLDTQRNQGRVEDEQEKEGGWKKEERDYTVNKYDLHIMLIVSECFNAFFQCHDRCVDIPCFL